jgi:hypothetical protein
LLKSFSAASNAFTAASVPGLGGFLGGGGAGTGRARRIRRRKAALRRLAGSGREAGFGDGLVERELFAAPGFLAGATFFPDSRLDLTGRDFLAEPACFFADGAFFAGLFADFGDLAEDFVGFPALRAFGDEVIRPGR